MMETLRCGTFRLSVCGRGGGAPEPPQGFYERAPRAPLPGTYRTYLRGVRREPVGPLDHVAAVTPFQTGN